MNPGEAGILLEEQGVRADAAELAATAALVTALLQGTAGSFAKLPLEAEPAGFQTEQRRNSP
jgi:hypothetical protein